MDVRLEFTFFGLSTVVIHIFWRGTALLSDVDRTLSRDIIAFFNGGFYYKFSGSYAFPSVSSLLHFGFLTGLTDNPNYIWYSGKAFDNFFPHDDEDEDEDDETY